MDCKDRDFIKWVENLLNGDIDKLSFYEGCFSEDENFKLNYIKRLQIAYFNMLENNMFYYDFLIALRDFLLFFNTDIEIRNFELDDCDEVGIYRDSEKNTYFAKYDLNKEIPNRFLEDTYKGIKYKNEGCEYENLMTNPLINSLTGFDTFKSMSQKLSVTAALNTPNGYTTLISLPTGGGKSLITQSLAYQQHGLTIVIVPTVSLAKDQVIAAKGVLKRSNLDSEIFEYTSGVDLQPILDAIRNETARLLFISPESLMMNERLGDILNEANRKRYLKNIVIDEAHIVVDWGSYFRIDYQCIETWRKKLIWKNGDIRTILLSATFDNYSRDILKAFFSSDNKWIEVRCDSLRHEPRFVPIIEKNYIEKFNDAISLIKKLPHPMIVYVSNPDEAEELKLRLNTEGVRNVETFTGKTSSSKREILIEKWRENRFSIMIATSAFGIGVDKNDVRTVLHLYVPPNPNAYYQELGRGGRDGRACLSVMCVSKRDIDISRKQIGKRVMTTDKILGRWDSMFNSKYSLRSEYGITIDTSIKPKYNVGEDEKNDYVLNDEMGTRSDMNWNIYVLLLLRRHMLIDIKDVVIDDDGIYFITIDNKNIDNLLFENYDRDSVALYDRIEAIREIEYRYYMDSFSLIDDAITHCNERCWSEMFCETYKLSSYYCAGCRSHKSEDLDLQSSVIKQSVEHPLQEIRAQMSWLFSSSNEIIINLSGSKTKLLKQLMAYGINVIVDDEMTCRHIDSPDDADVFIIGSNELIKLLQIKMYYFISGVIAIVYPDDENKVFHLYKYVRRYIIDTDKIGKIKVIHIVRKDYYLSGYGKTISDVTNGVSVSSDYLIKEKVKYV